MTHREIALLIGCGACLVLGHCSGEFYWYARGYFKGYAKAIEDYRDKVN